MSRGYLVFTRPKAQPEAGWKQTGEWLAYTAVAAASD